MLSLSSLTLSPAKAGIAIALGGVTCSACLALTLPDYWLQGTVLSLALSWATLVDIDRQIIPNLITLSLVATGLVVGAMAGEQIFIDRAIGAVAGYTALTVVRALYARARKRDGLGMGDAKLFAAGGAWLGWIALPYVMLFAAVAALLTIGIQFARGRAVRSDQRLAFGPFLSMAIWTIWLLQAVDLLIFSSAF